MNINWYAIYNIGTGEITSTLTSDDDSIAFNTPEGCSAVVGDYSAFNGYILDGVYIEYAYAQKTDKAMRPDWANRWSNETLCWIDLRSLSDLKARRWNEIKQERTARLVGNITVGGRTYQCNQAAMAGAALAAFMATVDGTTATFAQPWVLTDNTSAELTAAETIAMGLAARDYVNGLSTATQAIRDALDALEPGSTPADIAAASAWPS
jgi:hypothetical protein